MEVERLNSGEEAMEIGSGGRRRGRIKFTGSLNSLSSSTSLRGLTYWAIGVIQVMKADVKSWSVERQPGIVQIFRRLPT